MGEDTQDGTQDRKKKKKKENKPPQTRQLETFIYSDDVLVS